MPAPKTPKLIRQLHRGDNGPDVLALKRALADAGYKGTLPTRTFGSGCDRALRKFQQAKKLPVDGVLGNATFNALLPYVDSYGLSLFAKAPRKSKEEETFARLLSFMEKMSRDTPGYLLGGGHGVPLAEVRTTQLLDCSSSCSLALWQVGLFSDDFAWNSTGFEQYGDSGSGSLFTVYANWDHVWIRLHKGPYWRFDTSPHGDGGRGPQLRKMPRFTSGFVARHRPGY